MRRVIPLGLAVVAVCAVILSFSALYDLARLCGFGERLAALVPVLADAGAAVATAVWLAGDVTTRARRYARRLALALLAASVLGNAGAHALVAAGARPHWVVVVAVGALAPAVLAAVIHLAALVRAAGDELATAGDATGDRQEDEPGPMEKALQLAAEGAGRPALVACGITEHQARQLIRQHRQSDETAIAPGRTTAQSTGR